MSFGVIRFYSHCHNSERPTARPPARPGARPPEPRPPGYRHANLRDKKSGRPTGRGLWGPPTPPIGVRGDAPVGAQGAKPPEAPGFMRILK